MNKITSYDKILSNEIKNQIKLDYLEGISIPKLGIKYNIKSKEYIRKLLVGLMRTPRESSKLAHKLYPDNFKLSDCAKNKIREARLRYMKEHPEDTAWRKRNKPSYPEECFIKYIKDRKLDQKYTIEREKSFFPYFADFTFEQLKLVIEIDGSQHLNEDRKLSDIKKDNLIRSLGWKVIRITENTVKTDWESIDEIFTNFNNLDNLNIKTLKVGIFKYKSKRKVERLYNGLTQKQLDSSINQRKVSRPSKEELLQLIIKNPFTQIGKMYGVSDKAISKWCKFYNLPHRKKDLKEFLKSSKN